MSKAERCNGEQVFNPPRRCKGAPKTDAFGKTGYLLALVYCSQLWGVVVWDGEEDPETYKASCLLVQPVTWEKVGR